MFVHVLYGSGLVAVDPLVSKFDRSLVAVIPDRWTPPECRSVRIKAATKSSAPMEWSTPMAILLGLYSSMTFNNLI